jgi:hypothetical protein
MASKDGRLPSEKRHVNWGETSRENFDFFPKKCYEESVNVLGWSEENLATAQELTADSEDTADQYTLEGALKGIVEDPTRDMFNEVKYFVTEEFILIKFFKRTKPENVVDDPKKPSKSVRGMMRFECFRSVSMARYIKSPMDIVALLWEQFPPALAYLYPEVSCFSYPGVL